MIANLNHFQSELHDQITHTTTLNCSHPDTSRISSVINEKTQALIYEKRKNGKVSLLTL